VGGNQELLTSSETEQLAKNKLPTVAPSHGEGEGVFALVYDAALLNITQFGATLVTCLLEISFS
jgi:hypothetical protein